MELTFYSRKTVDNRYKIVSASKTNLSCNAVLKKYNLLFWALLFSGYVLGNKIMLVSFSNYVIFQNVNLINVRLHILQHALWEQNCQEISYIKEETCISNCF